MAKKVRPTMAELAKACEGKTLEEIKTYFVEGDIINTPYIPHEQVMAACSLVMKDACYRDEKYYVDSDTVEVLTTVYSFFLHTNIDCVGYTYEEVFDIIKKYHFDQVFYMIYHDEIFNPVSYAVYNKINDIQENEHSTEAVMLKLLDIFNKSVKEISNAIEQNPELIKAYLNQPES